MALIWGKTDDRLRSKSLLKIKESTSNWRIIPFQNNLTVINTNGGTNWKQACIINLIYPQRLRFNEWIFLYNFSCQWRRMLRILQMLKGFSSWGSLTSRSQRRINFSEQQGSEYNPMVKNVTRFVLYAGAGGRGFSKKLTGRLCSGVQPLTLTQERYPFCIPYIEKWYPFHIPTLRTLHPFQLL